MNKLQLQCRLHYNPATGVFTRIFDTQGRRIGGLSGTVMASGAVTICGKRYTLARLAWLYMTGEWPERNVMFKNGRSGDYRWENLDLSDHCSRAGRAA